VDKPKDVAVCGACASVHLDRPIALAYHNLITKVSREISGTIVTSPICDNNLCLRRPLAYMSQTWPYQRSLIKNWNDDGGSHLAGGHCGRIIGDARVTATPGSIARKLLPSSVNR
jgi:uncharacterized membrane protein